MTPDSLLFVRSYPAQAPALSLMEQTETRWKDYGRQIDSTQLLHRGSESDVWGAGSSVIILPAERSSSQHLTTDTADSSAFSAFILLMTCLYCYILYRFRRDILLLFKNSTGTETLLGLRNGQGADFSYLLRWGILLALADITITAAAWIKTLLAQPDHYLLAGALAAVVGYTLYRAILLTAIRIESIDHTFTSELRFINRINTTLLALFYTPFAIMIGASGQPLLAGGIFLLLLILYHFLTLYKYFTLRGFSKLQLILYLCAIEILPVSFFVAIAVRNQYGI